jgi:chromosome partitioning protein
MAAKIIIATNQKGGAGKTNVSVHLAGTFIRHKYKTLLVDADAQGTATKWAAQAEEDYEHKIRVMGLAKAETKIGREIKQYVDDYDVIIVDCPPSVDSQIPQVMLMIADLALVPIVPNPGDLWASTDLLELAERTQVVNPGLQIRIVGSNVRANLAMTKQGLETMAMMRDSAPLLKTKLQQRTAYVESMLAGDSVHYFGSAAKAAIKEIESLYEEVVAILNLPKVKK